MKKIVIFASGSGTNAANIIKHFQKTKTAFVTQVLCNNKQAKVFERCKNLNTEVVYFDKNSFLSSKGILSNLKKNADYIVLAGFLWKIPSFIITAFPNKIINIHPALLPKYGGKGMYGMNVHKAVKKNKEKETGITVHYVNEYYDEGRIIFQAKTVIYDKDSSKKIAEKVHKLEQKHFPKVIEQLIIN